MSLKLNELAPSLRQRIQQQIAREDRARLGTMETKEQQCRPSSSLVTDRLRKQKSKGSVAVIVTIITCRMREADDDNHVAACKPLRDAIAATLGLDDGDRRIRWEYGQCESHGIEGVIVKIELK